MHTVMPSIAAQATLREAVPADAVAVHDVVLRAFEEYRDRLDPPSGAHSETVAAIAALIQRERGAVALCGGRIVGCVFSVARLDGQGGTELYLHRLAVLPQWRGAGIGAALVAAVEERARALGIDWVALGVRIGLPGNRRFYERLGYAATALGTHPGYTQPTFVTMRKRVANPPPAAT